MYNTSITSEMKILPYFKMVLSVVTLSPYLDRLISIYPSNLGDI